MERVFRTVKDRDDVTVGGILSSLCKDALNGTIVLDLLKKLGDKSRLPRYTKTNNMEDALLYDFPRILYRELMSYQVTNWYVLPYSGKIDFGSRGQNGWQPRDLSNRFQFITNTLKNVNINIRPLWKMTSQDGDSIDFELTLFNDTIDSAV